jgi:periplasmic protein TonB
MELQGQPLPYPRNVPGHTFWIGLSCAALLHACLILSVGRAAPRQLGERDGNPDTISVELVDPAALRASAQSARPPQGGADAGHAAPSPPPAAPVNPVPVNPVPAAPSPPGVAPSSAPADLATAPAGSSPPSTEVPPSAQGPPPAVGKKTATLSTPDATSAAQPLGSIPPLSATPPSTPAPDAAKTKSQPRPSLQLDLPPEFATPSGLSTAAVRPPDITRSGENDEFGRRVIRALRQTMPAARGELGRVTVRLLLSATGDLVEVQLVRPASDPILTQSVVFAVKQASFPIPPAGATRSDRTFLVTYIYN